MTVPLMRRRRDLLPPPDPPGSPEAPALSLAVIEAHPLDGRGAEPAAGLPMGRGGIALVPPVAVLGIEPVVALHRPVAGDLGEDRSGHDRGHDAVALDHRRRSDAGAEG